jgi:hypothetical protein
MGGTCGVGEEPGKQKPRSCRAQELAETVPRKRSGRKTVNYRNQLINLNRHEEETRANRQAIEVLVSEVEGTLAVVTD